MDDNDLRQWFDNACINELVGYRSGGAESFEDAEALLKIVRQRAYDRVTGRIKETLDPNTHPASEQIRLLAEGVIASRGDA